MNIEDLPKPILIEDLGMVFATKDSKERKRFGMYECGFCGNKFKTCTSGVKFGNTNSCGCYNIRAKTHGMSDTRLYSIWRGMKKRTTNISHQAYPRYGGRGIIVCDEWKNNFMSFYEWAILNGYSDELCIDRIDNDRNYEPSNCRWATRVIQGRNRRIRKGNKTGYKGVSFSKNTNTYVAIIYIKGKAKYLKYSKSVIECAIAYNNYIIENNLEGFILNEIPAGY